MGKEDTSKEVGYNLLGLGLIPSYQYASLFYKWRTFDNMQQTALVLGVF